MPNALSAICECARSAVASKISFERTQFWLCVCYFWEIVLRSLVAWPVCIILCFNLFVEFRGVLRALSLSDRLLKATPKLVRVAL